MKSHTFITRLTGILLTFFVVTNLFSQSVNINYKQKGKNISTARIFFSGSNGQEQISPAEFLGFSKAYFTILPNDPDGKNYFKESDIEDGIDLIRFYQGQNEIKSDTSMRLVMSADLKKIEKVILSYPKRQIKLYNPFVFLCPSDTVIMEVLDDTYYMYYNKYKEIYQNGLNFSSRKDFIETYTTLMTIVKDAETMEEIKHYDFYQHASEALIENAIGEYADSLAKVFNYHNSQFAKNFSESSLNKCDSIYRMLEETYGTFLPYLNLTFKESKNLKDNYNKLLNEMNSEIEQNRLIFNKNRLIFLETGKYAETNDSYRFNLFIDIITHLVTRLDTLKILDGLSPINLKLLDQIPQKKQELMNTGWYHDFEILAGILNESIRSNGIIFNDSVMNNLQRQVTTQRQPYYEIFLAFSKLNHNQALFRDYLLTAISRCSDIDLLLNLEMWIQSYSVTFENIDPQIVTRINEGIRLIEKKQWQQADNLFDVITKQASNIAPAWFYSGKIKYETAEAFSADSKFELALKLYPMYIAPRIYSFTTLESLGNFDVLLKKIDEAILVSDLWYFHSRKAMTLYALKNYKQVIKEINEMCIVKNPWDVNQYFLLGDAYLEINDLTNAELSYRKAQEIDPFTDVTSVKFNEKMTLLQGKRK